MEHQTKEHQNDELLFKILRCFQDSESLICSPLSAQTSLAVLHDGSRNGTKTELADCLNYSDHNDAEAHFVALVQRLTRKEKRKGYSMEMFSSLWHDNNVVLCADYQHSIKEKFLCESHQTDFRNPAAAVQAINEAVSERTDKEITQIVDVKDFASGTELILINTIYISAKWETPFYAPRPRPHDFFLGDGSTKQVDLMTKKEISRYYEDDLFQTLRIPYETDAVAMYVLLPKAHLSAADLIGSLDDEKTNNYISSACQAEKVVVSILFPKFECETTVDLKKPLCDMGVTQIFTPEAETSFGAVRKIIQKCVIRIDEIGTVAAAVTKTLRLGSCRPQLAFTADHPFLYFIVPREVEGGALCRDLLLVDRGFDSNSLKSSIIPLRLRPVYKCN